VLRSHTGRIIAAAALVGYPLSIFMYWLLYPAYGKSGATAILRAIDGHAAGTAVADVFAFAGAFMAVPASLALMTLLLDRRSRIGWVGGVLSALGWIALVGLLMLDVVGVEITRGSGPTPAMIHVFHEVLSSPLTVALEVVATLHVVGGVLIGVGLIRTRMIRLTAAILATVTPILHLASNVAGVLWLDEITWLALAIAYGLAARVLLDEGQGSVSRHRARARPARPADHACRAGARESR
jgi:hypothetical protein